MKLSSTIPCILDLRYSIKSFTNLPVMKCKIASILLLALLFAAPSMTFAQFEGKIVFQSYNMEEDGSQNDDQFTLFITPERILMQGTNRYDVTGSIQTEGILVRLEEEDFVLFTDSDKALSISRQDIDSMMKMFENGENTTNGNPEVDASVSYERTGDTRSINGYNCELFIFRDEDDENRRAEVWMTRDISINWGMLANSWRSITGEVTDGDIPLALIFEDSYFPLLIESYEREQLVSRLEAEEIESTTEARDHVQIPAGVKVLNFQQYLFESFNKQ